MTDAGISTGCTKFSLLEDVQHLAVDLPVPERRVGDAEVRPAVAVQPLRVAQRQAPHLVRIPHHRKLPSGFRFGCAIGLTLRSTKKP